MNYICIKKTMEQERIKAEIQNLYIEWAGEKMNTITELALSGSNRKYYHISSDNKTAIATYNQEIRENKAFFHLSEVFFKQGLNVPEIYKINPQREIYLQQYLGNTTLYSFLEVERKNETIPEKVINAYKQVIEELPKFQVGCMAKIDYNKCYPRESFDKQSIMWDLNYFKYYFLKLSGINFDEQLLEDDFNNFSEYLLTADREYFLYRDMQSRNIMIYQDKPYFIDYQGGRKGALHYDIASLLYDSKANLSEEIRTMLLKHYIFELNKHLKISEKEFNRHYYAYVIIRILQAMGAYGYRGFYEKKTIFLESIPYAIKNLKFIIENKEIGINTPVLASLLDKISSSQKIKHIINQEKILNVSINSFSYKKNIPVDESGNGGGFVFDCRAINNPGRDIFFKDKNGKDKEVIEFLQKENQMEEFLENVYKIVDSSIKTYLERGFTNLMVSFGCTGGQHRSVYCAENLAKHINEKFNVKINIRHRELEKITLK